jgi:predicted secreted Zn-dependent protease
LPSCIYRPRAALLISFLLVASSTSAEVLEILDYDYYEVIAQPDQTLLSALNRSSPILTDGRVFHAYTKWNVGWKLWWDANQDAACRISSVQTSLTGSIKLPRLVSGNAEQRLEFERYVLALKQHESGHYEIGKDAAQAIDREILSLPPATDCSSLEKAANEIAVRTLERYKEKERTYDATTRHGKTQGAWLKR